MSVGDETAALFTFTSITPVCYTLHIGSHEDIYERTLQIQSEPATERTANPKHQDREHTLRALIPTRELPGGANSERILSLNFAVQLAPRPVFGV